jgi:copper chaperone NosL
MRARLLLWPLVLAVGCSPSAPAPSALDSAHDACQTCRMIVSDARRASQVVAPYEEPKFFDDLNCLRAFIAAKPGPSAGAVIYVADHRTREWVRWDRAVFTRVPTLAGSMGSDIIAHASAASRDADRDATGGTSVDAHDAVPFGPRGGS